MIRIWQLQEAKSKLSQVVDNAISDGPQVITRRGVQVAIVLSYSEYRKLVSRRGGLLAFFRNSPLAGVGLDLARDTSPVRKDVTL